MSRSPTERLLLTPAGLVDARGQAWPDFGAWCAARAGARVELLAGPRHMHCLLIPGDLPLADEEARLRYARLQFTHYFGAQAQHWPLAAWACGACALVDVDLAALQATATAHRVRLTSMRPSWTLAEVAEGDSVVLDGDMLTLLRMQGGELVELQQRHVDDEPQAARINDVRELLSASGGQPGPDFIAQPSRLRPLMWAWAATAAAACVLVVMQAQGQREEAQRLAEQAAVLDRIARPAAAARAKPADPAKRTQAWAVARQLDTDWAALWTDVERAIPPGLQLAALDLDRQGLRAEGQAGDADTVTRFVDRLALQAGPRDEVVLTRLQRPDASEGELLRFELVRRAAGAAR